MPDNVAPERRSQIMAKVRSRDTAPELAVRRAVHRAGFRYRLHRADLPGTPDLVFPRHRLAVFVHGCFWHWHGCKRSRMPAANRDYWERKIARNVARDTARQTELTALGWETRVIWECALDAGIAALIAELAERVERSRSREVKTRRGPGSEVCAPTLPTLRPDASAPASAHPVPLRELEGQQREQDAAADQSGERQRPRPQQHRQHDEQRK
ncbi:MAG: DNA mismatch endonuclease Vsr [Thermomicrobiales bacterium]|nr:DNA mismatch endonuclease Vsr [Thermomicrobiales bacterium]